MAIFIEFIFKDEFHAVSSGKASKLQIILNSGNIDNTFNVLIVETMSDTERGRIQRRKMKYLINSKSVGEKLVEADFFKIENDFVWFFKGESQVVSLQRAEFINTIDYLG